MNAGVSGLREHRLRALGVEPLRVRHRDLVAVVEPCAAALPAANHAPPADAAAVPVDIRRLALHPDPDERRDPAIDKMYMALTEAVTKAGLQPVRVCDVAGDSSAAVIVFGAMAAPEGVPAARVLHVDSLGVLHADRERKRHLWELMLALGAGRS